MLQVEELYSSSSSHAEANRTQLDYLIFKEEEIRKLKETTRMDKQLADKAMVELRSILIDDFSHKLASKEKELNDTKMAFEEKLEALGRTVGEKSRENAFLAERSSSLSFELEVYDIFHITNNNIQQHMTYDLGCEEYTIAQRTANKSIGE